MSNKDKDKLIKELKERIAQLEKERIKYMHEMLDLVKRREINVHHTQKKIRTMPWTSGYERTKEIQKLQQEKKRKRNKTRK